MRIASENQSSGFTLLETLIALAIMAVAILAIFSSLGNSVSNSKRTEVLNVMTMLGKNAMIETEFALEGKTFTEVDKEKSGTFPEPHQEYSWTRKIKELKFPTLNFNAGNKEEDSDSQDQEGGSGDMAGLLNQLISKYLSKTVREVNLTITYKTPDGEQKQTITTYWVDFEKGFDLE